jgi:hypothetical protein
MTSSPNANMFNLMHAMLRPCRSYSGRGHVHVADTKIGTSNSFCVSYLVSAQAESQWIFPGIPAVARFYRVGDAVVNWLASG